jgi:tetratricopeptide (TPR) repeat protein
MTKSRSTESSADAGAGARQATHAAPAAEGPELRMRLGLTALLVLQGVAAFLPGPLLWGLNHLAYAPLALRVVWPLAGLALVWTPLGERLGRFLSRSVGAGLLGRPFTAYMLAPLVGILLLWLARVRVYYLGDGWFLGELIARGHGFHGFDWIAYHLHARLLQWLGLQGEPAAYGVFATVSLIAGGLYLAAAAWGARGLARDPGARALIYALLVFFAPVQMFMGYVECYGLLLVATLVYLIALVRHARGEFTIAAPAAALGLALFLHLNALFLAPLLAVALLWPPSGKRASPRDVLAALGLPLAGLALAVLVHLVAGYGRAWFVQDFIEGRRGRTLLMPLFGSPGLLSLAHAKDVINLLLLLCPVPLAMMVATGLRGAPGGAGSPRDGGTIRTAQLLLLGCLCVLALAIGLDMVLGMPRDWDLLAAQAPVFALAAVVLWVATAGPRPQARTVGMIAATAFVLAAPWFWLNAGAERALERFADVLEGQSAYAQAYAHEEIGKYYRKLGEMPRALAEYRRAVALFPSNPRFHALLGGMLYNTGDKDGALEAFQRALAADPEYPNALEMMARLHAERGENEAALEYARKLAKRSQESPDAAEVYGLVAERLELNSEAIEAYQRAFTKDQTRTRLLERIGALGFLSGNLPVSEQAFRLLLEREPQSVTGREGLVLAVWGPLRTDPARWGTPEGRRLMEECSRLLDSLEREHEGDEMTASWRREIEAARRQPAAR